MSSPIDLTHHLNDRSREALQQVLSRPEHLKITKKNISVIFVPYECLAGAMNLINGLKQQHLTGINDFIKVYASLDYFEPKKTSTGTSVVWLRDGVISLYMEKVPVKDGNKTVPMDIGNAILELLLVELKIYGNKPMVKSTYRSYSEFISQI